MDKRALKLREIVAESGKEFSLKEAADTLADFDRVCENVSVDDYIFWSNTTDEDLLRLSRLWSEPLKVLREVRNFMTTVGRKKFVEGS